MAAEAIDRRLCGHPKALTLYARQVEHGFNRYLEMRADYYACERRWPNSAFWRRRQQPIVWPEPLNLRKEIRSQSYLIL
jgi:hypothetical protein